MSVNPCFEFLDRAVIGGRADAPVLSAPETSHARLLEDVAAVAGVLRAVGVEPGGRVAVHVADDLHAVTAALAALRLGAVPVPDPTAPVRVEDRGGESHLVWAEDTALDWAAILKAGRTDPAAAYETAAGDPASSPDLREVVVPIPAGELRRLLLGV